MTIMLEIISIKCAMSILNVEKMKLLQQRHQRKWGYKKMELSGHIHQGDKRVCRCLSIYQDNCVYVLMTLYILSWPNLPSLAVKKLSAKCITQRL